jgi:hypothetical protein
MPAIPAPDEQAAGYAGTVPQTAQGSHLGLALGLGLEWGWPCVY